MRLFSLLLALTLLAASSSPIAFQEKAEYNLEEASGLCTLSQQQTLKQRSILKTVDVKIYFSCDAQFPSCVFSQNVPSISRYLKHCILLI